MTNCLIIADFTAKALAGHLENSAGSPDCTVAEAPFDQVSQVILQTDHPCWAEKPDCVVVWTRPERVSLSFARIVAGEAASENQVTEEVNAFCELLSNLEGRMGHCFVPTWTVTLPRRGLGLIDLKKDKGISYHLARMNMQLMETMSSSRAFYVLDSSRWLQAAGKWGYTPKSWYLAKIPFGNEVFALAAKDIKAGLRALQGKSKKLIVLDLDGTLWGGILGEVGWANLAIGGHDPVGEAYADFQRELKILKNRGVVLAIASKNEKEAAFEAIARHPEMVLKQDDFVACRINWDDKVTSIADLVFDLNIGLDAVVFFDDNPAERSRVREALPQVFVPELPNDPLQFASFLRELDCFDPVSVSETDKSRTQLYHLEQERKALRAGVQSFDEWLERLQTRLIIEPLSKGNWDRALQLLNKTNQMNLRTRRLADAELKAWTTNSQNRFWTLRVMDRFGDSGLVGLMSLESNGASAEIVDFVLSCRVMGRRIEEAMLHQLLSRAAEMGSPVVEAEYIPTAKNAPCLRFFERACNDRQGNVFRWDSPRSFEAPKYVTIETAS